MSKATCPSASGLGCGASCDRPGPSRSTSRRSPRSRRSRSSSRRAIPARRASLREGLAEALTLTRLGVTGPLKVVLASTNPVESMIEIVRATQRNVKRWRSGEMALRWTAARMLEAERQFHRVAGYRDLPKLLTAIERELHGGDEAPMIEAT